jgi:N-acetylneuraminate synthase
MQLHHMRSLRIGSRLVGPGQSVYVIAEIGINHNGDLAIARKLIDTAKLAGCDAVKFQKRTPELCVPAAQRDLVRDTPWGPMTYLDYRHRVEFGEAEYAQIDAHCKHVGIDWFASCWDEPSVDFIERFQPVCYKIASASVTDEPLIRRVNATGRPIILSTGMSSLDEIRRAVSLIDRSRLALCHTTSTYPARTEELNLRMIGTLTDEFGLPVGYSGHETGLQSTYAAVALGACLIERHITLDRAMWGSDQSASVEPQGLMRLVRDVRIIERSLGDGVKRVYDSEKPIRAKLRRDKPRPEVVRQLDTMAANRALKDRHAGQRCFVLATGPSIKKQSLGRLAGQTCISVSNFFVHPDAAAIAPRYHVIAPHHPPITEEAWAAWMREVATGTGDAALLFGVTDIERNAAAGCFAGRQQFHLGFGTPIDLLTAHGADLTRPLPTPQSVTVMACYAALYMGFSEIVLLGCDHDWILHLNVSSHFYGEEKHALNQAGYQEYFGERGFDGYCGDYVRLWEQYRAVKAVADSRGCRIINATAGGLLDVFPRASLESLLDGSAEQRAAA